MAEVDYSYYYYRPNRKKRKAKSGVIGRLIAILCIALCFILFIVLFTRIKPGNGHLRLDESGHSIEVFEGCYYGLQMGSYSSATGAESAALVLKQRGGAGYVIEVGGVFYVTAASYTKKADAESVAKALSGAGETCAVLELKIRAGRVKLNTGGKPLAAVYNAMQFFYDAAEDLERIGFSVDKGELDAAGAVAQAAALTARLNKIIAAVQAEGKDIGFEAKLTSSLQAVAVALQGFTVASATATELSTTAKYAALAALDHYIRLLAEIY